MGNCINNKKLDELNTCFICSKTVHREELCKCVRCKIALHKSCEENYRNNKEYCQCPNCNKFGTLGIINDK